MTERFNHCQHLRTAENTAANGGCRTCQRIKSKLRYVPRPKIERRQVVRVQGVPVPQPATALEAAWK